MARAFGDSCTAALLLSGRGYLESVGACDDYSRAYLGTLGKTRTQLLRLFLRFEHDDCDTPPALVCREEERSLKARHRRQRGGQLLP